MIIIIENIHQAHLVSLRLFLTHNRAETDETKKSTHLHYRLALIVFNYFSLPHHSKNLFRVLIWGLLDFIIFPLAEKKKTKAVRDDCKKSEFRFKHKLLRYRHSAESIRLEMWVWLWSNLKFRTPMVHNNKKIMCLYQVNLKRMRAAGSETVGLDLLQGQYFIKRGTFTGHKPQYHC